MILVGVLVLAAGVASAMIWQHSRYLAVRRDLAHDRQEIWHSSSAFHAVVFLAVEPGADPLEAVRALKRATENEARWIYAGQCISSGLQSAQIGKKDWSAIALLEYPSREAFDTHARSEAFQEARSRFAEVYVQGFERSSLISALIPQALLALRLGQLVTFQPSHFPFQRAEGMDDFPDAEEMAARMRSAREFGSEAIMVVNLIRQGSSEQSAANRNYVLRMMGAMAEGGYGVMHMGRAVQVERDYEFDSVGIVFYPGVDFFADMSRSEFFQGVIGDKQLGDTQATITVPILDRL